MQRNTDWILSKWLKLCSDLTIYVISFEYSIKYEDLNNYE